MKQYMRRSIKDLKPYHASHITEGIKLDANENTYPLLEGLKAHMAEWAMEMPINYYPDTDSTKLRKAIGEAYDVALNQVICGVGSDQLIDCILRTFLEKGDKVVVPTPSFSMYGLTTKLNEGVLVEVPLDQDFNYQVEKTLQVIAETQPKVVILCNPNNPTGTLIDQQAIATIAGHTDGIVIVDEAYIEFHEQSAVGLIDTYPNIIVLRTFSKAYGLAGARIGYGIADCDLIECLECVRPPYNINIMSQEVAHYVITHRGLFQETIAKIKDTRDKVRAALIEKGYVVAPSATNFLWIQTETALEEVLRASQVHIKGFNYGKQYYRMSIGTEQEMEQVIHILEEWDENSTY